jgi:hypothetical protein
MIVLYPCNPRNPWFYCPRVLPRITRITRMRRGADPWRWSAARSNQGAPANRRRAGQSDGSDNLSAIVAADRAFPAAVAELDRSLKV